MRTLRNHIILYDEECPMCKAYTRGFVKAGMLGDEGRQSYQQVPAAFCPLIDKQRAADEIALVNTETGTVSYGIDSLFTVIGHSFPVFAPLFGWKPFRRLARKSYAFISYNRRVIIPVDTRQQSASVQPRFRLSYRIAYLAVAWLITSFVLSRYSVSLEPLLPPGPWYREWLICAGQIPFQALVIHYTNPAKTWQYLGNMMTISLAGALLLLPLLLVGKLLHAPVAFFAGSFLLVAALMLLEHIRRCRLLGVSAGLSVSWVLYRVILLFIIV